MRKRIIVTGVLIAVIMSLTAICATSKIMDVTQDNVIIEEEIIVENWMTESLVVIEDTISVEPWMTELFI